MIRFLLAILLLLISLLAVFRAPEYHLWMLAILVTEFPWIFMALTIGLILMGFYTNKYHLAGTTTAIIALMLFTSPIIRAYTVAGSLKQAFTQAFAPDDSSTDSLGNLVPFSFWKQFSRTTKIACRQITYSNPIGANLTLDYYPSQLAGKRPCVIVVHGGSWSKGDNKQLPELNSYLASIGYNVAAINYRLAPAFQNPAPIIDIHAAINYLREHATELRVDTNNFVLLGRSAGAQVALLAAYTLTEPGLKGVIDYYGPADMVWGYSAPASPLVMNSRKVMENYLGGKYRQIPQKYHESSPIEFVTHQTVPTLIIHGDNDVLVSPEHSTRLNAKLKQNIIKHFLLKLPWATHGFDYNLNGPGGQLATYTVVRFLNQVVPYKPE
ncbi:alpha/beta hydrolase [Mucilaginibacter sabulilitoris]|uniref:Alpha/beta hydrolase n=1 Tax=Mucilaginibacter sabulilitoris TaxID=1173583 RepID=A0ABZ0TP37_9SPHI|nr:alpha/beta hydrolase [Mucilaginibacter sabulilitoris]WPU94222.1 alpha/beta hydrolase [Mucilaginibacter sabulilitoris]